ncbi:PsbQ-like protein 2, chloroplastic [Dendrobium catenatum]|uniref:PsbQ-like protein 2, chloroplastic n=1 Tax=Dendrobium catenatum TaxID=906689 RepID=A0A2I0WI96_9ASPA|nr:PsbQ-like protein 2, chloroplastic [Dendrobium catenatum]
MENLECKGSVFRFKNCFFYLLSLGEDLINVDDDNLLWEFIGRDIRLKSTFLYCDIHHVISCYRDEHKRNQTDKFSIVSTNFSTSSA